MDKPETIKLAASRLVLAVFGAVLLGVSGPAHPDFWPLAWLAFLPICFAVRGLNPLPTFFLAVVSIVGGFSLGAISEPLNVALLSLPVVLVLVALSIRAFQKPIRILLPHVVFFLFYLAFFFVSYTKATPAEALVYSAIIPPNAHTVHSGFPFWNPFLLTICWLAVVGFNGRALGLRVTASVVVLGSLAIYDWQITQSPPLSESNILIVHGSEFSTHDIQQKLAKENQVKRCFIFLTRPITESDEPSFASLREGNSTHFFVFYKPEHPKPQEPSVWNVSNKWEVLDLSRSRVRSVSISELANYYWLTPFSIGESDSTQLYTSTVMGIHYSGPILTIPDKDNAEALWNLQATSQYSDVLAVWDDRIEIRRRYGAELTTIADEVRLVEGPHAPKRNLLNRTGSLIIIAVWLSSPFAFLCLIVSILIGLFRNQNRQKTKTPTINEAQKNR